MTVAVETVAVAVLDIETGVEIPVAIPVFTVEEIEVTYGRSALPTVRNIDYTVELLDPTNFNTFKITPLAAFLTKINNLIAADPTEINAAYIRRVLDYKTSATADGVKNTPYTAREFDRTVARFQQIKEALARCVKFTKSVVVGEGDGDVLTVLPLSPDRVPVVSTDGAFLHDGPSITQIENAEDNAQAAAASAAAAAADRVQTGQDRTAASNSAGAALASENHAQEWAEKPEDVEVVPGKFSALHWAAKAAAMVIGNMGGVIHAAANKATPVDADELALSDSAAAWALRRLSIANLKEVFKTTPWVPVGGPAPSDPDLNTYLSGGFQGRIQLTTTSIPNAPPSTGLFYVLVFETSSTRTTQILIPYTNASQGIWFRTQTTAWSAWERFARMAEVLPLVGGTMTGKITLDGNPSSNLHAATKQYVDDLALGVGQTWQTPTRVAGTTYQNTTGRPIALSIRMVQGAARDLEISTNGTTWSKLMTSGGAEALSCFAVIPNNYYYRVLTAVGAWMELR